MKFSNSQSIFNRQVKDEDAMYKLYAYMEQKRKSRVESEEVRKHHMEDPKEILGLEDFESYYQQQLVKDAFKTPRKIDEVELRPKRKQIESSLYSDDIDMLPDTSDL